MASIIRISPATSSLPGELTTQSGLSVVTSPLKNGSYAYKIDPAGGTAFGTKTFASTSGLSVIYYRIYVYVTTVDGITEDTIFNVSSTETQLGIVLTTAGTLKILDIWNGAYVGSASSVLSTSTWYRVELSMDSTTLSSTAVTARLDGTQFASGTANLTGTGGSPYKTLIGSSYGSSSLYYLQSIAINDNSGTNDNSFPGTYEPSNTGNYGTIYTRQGFQ